MLLERSLEGMRDYHRILCACSPGGRVLELEGVEAALMPAVPENPVLNGVVYERASALGGALHELGAAYDEAGVEAWTVWVPAVDGDARRLLRGAGHRLDANPVAMARELGDIDRPAEPVLGHWTPVGDSAAMAAISDRAFFFGSAFARAFARPLPDRARVYLASLDGQPASCVLTSDHHGNCAVNLVATVPEARGRGLSGALLAHALADAAERGCEITTLVATPMARAGYERLGYRAICPLEQWVRRRDAA